MRSKSNGLIDGFEKTLFICHALSSDVECGSMIDRCTNHRKSDRNVYTGFDPHDLNGAVALIVVHRDHQIEFAPLSAEEQRVGRQWSLGADPSRVNSKDRWLDFVLLFTVPEQTMLARMRVDTAHADARPCYTRPDQRLLSADDGALDQARLDFDYRV